MEFLKSSFEHGYNNIEHMCKDLDLLFIKTVLTSQNKWEEFVDQMRKLRGLQDVPNQPEQIDPPANNLPEANIEVHETRKTSVKIEEPVAEIKNTLPEPPKNEVPQVIRPDSKYAKEIASMKEMGFDLAESTLEIILEHHRGNVDHALSEIV